MAVPVHVIHCRRLEHVLPDADPDGNPEVMPHPDNGRGLWDVGSGGHVAPHGEAGYRGFFLPRQSRHLAAPWCALFVTRGVGCRGQREVSVAFDDGTVR